MSYAYNQESQRQALTGTIIGLMKELQNLAPHPDCPSYKGPLFIQSSPYFKQADDRDGMLGSMIMEGILGVAFSEAVSNLAESATQGFDLPHMNMPNIDMSNLMDCYSEYITDVSEDREKRLYTDAHGQGTLARLSGKSLSKGFNMRATISAGMQAFFADLPKRMVIEQNMATCAAQLDMLDNAPHYQYEARTARPGMAA